MRISQAVEDFTKEVALSKSQGTARGYNHDLSHLVHLSKRNSVLEFDDELVRRYFVTMSERGLSQASLARKAASMGQFAKWGLRKKYWHENPMLNPMYRFKKPERLPRPLSADEVTRMMALPLPPAQEVLRALLYYTGQRISSVCALRVSDLSFRPVQVTPTITVAGTIRMLVKGRKELTVPMQEELAAVLKPYLAQQGLQPYDPVLAQVNGKPMSTRSAERFVGLWGKAVAAEGVTPHRFRHTYATDLLEKGVDITVIQKLLGHSNLASTLLYTRVSNDAVFAAAALR